MTSKQIRQQFLDFFAGKAHAVVDSSPVVPHDDPTLMFTNAGMNQFKDVFLGTGSRSYKRAVDTQKCIRAGGKHNDLDDVGQDTYHHTFFEMLGNWSFGDYFKKEAIEWAWELFTEVWGIDKDRLHATYFEGDPAEGLEPDHETRKLWKSATDIDPSHVHLGNKKDNFWEMGDTGPCGPCSEIHIDLTPDKSGASLVNAGDPRVIELWNLVFIQFSAAWKTGGKERMHGFEKTAVPRNTDEDPNEYRRKYRLEHYGTDDRSVFLSECRSLSPLPAKHVDTGLGFERLAAVLLGMETGRLGEISNYDTDVFTPIFAAIQKRTGAPAYCGTLPGADSEPRTSIRAVLPDSEASHEHEPPSEPRAAPLYAKRQGSSCADASDQYRDREGAALDGTRTDETDHSEPRASARADTQSPDTPPSPERKRRDTHEQVMIDVSYRVIADHLRCLTFALTDGAIPSNEGRGYVLRRILRRAVRYGRQYMNMHEPFLCDLIMPLVDHMAGVFPELRTAHGGKNVEHITELIRDEEASFVKTLDRGLRILQEEIEFAHCARSRHIPGHVAFTLHDTFGFPIDLTTQICDEHGCFVDAEEYNRLMEKARQQSRTGAKSIAVSEVAGLLSGTKSARTRFVGYDTLQCDALVRITVATDPTVTIGGPIRVGERGIVVLDQTPFYCEKGGQVGDSGKIISPSGEFVVDETCELDGVVAHIGRCIEGEIWQISEHALNEPLVGVPDTVAGIPLSELPQEFTREAREVAERNRRIERGRSEAAHVLVSSDCRLPITQNHTSTHMLNWALRRVLEIEGGARKVEQKGSLVDPEKTRFDFSHNKPLTGDELARIEELVNDRIQQDLPVYTQEVDRKKALDIKTLRAVFGEKYPDVVRVVSIGAPIDEKQAQEAGRTDCLLASPNDPKWMEHAVEFCGGTHLKRTGEAGRFVLISEEAVAKGIRRVVGISGDAARRAVDLGQQLLAEAKALTGKPPAATDIAHPATNAGAAVDHSEPQAAPLHAKRQGSACADAGDQYRDCEGADLGTALSAFQQKFSEAVIPIRVRHELQQVIAELQKKLKEQLKKEAGASGDAVMDVVAGLLSSAETVGGVKVVVGEVPQAPTDALRGAIDWVRNKTESSAVLLAMKSADKVTLIAGMSKSVVKNGVKAGDLIKEVAPLVDGKGGGRPDMAQGGGNDPSGIPAALERAVSWIGAKLS